MSKRIGWGLLSLLIAGSALLRAAALSPEEAQKQADFKKAYKVPDKSERERALQMLEGLADPSTVALLISVCNTDPEKEVRLDAFRVLSKEPVHDASLAQTLVGIFQQQRDAETKLEYGKHLVNSEFKFAIASALMDWGTRLRYPDLLKVPNPPKNAKVAPADPNMQINKQREEFAAVFSLFNAVTKADIKGPDKNSPLEIRKWWDANSAKISTADADLVKKYKADDQAKKDAEKPKDEPKKDAGPAAK